MTPAMGSMPVARFVIDVQRDVAGLEDHADGHAEGLAADVALVNPKPGALAGQLADALTLLAAGADGAVRPQARLHPSVGSFFAMELRLGQNGRHCSSPVSPIYLVPLGTARKMLGR